LLTKNRFSIDHNIIMSSAPGSRRRPATVAADPRPKTMTQRCTSAKPKEEIAAMPEVVRGGVAGPQVNEDGHQAGP